MLAREYGSKHSSLTYVTACLLVILLELRLGVCSADYLRRTRIGRVQAVCSGLASAQKLRSRQEHEAHSTAH